MSSRMMMVRQCDELCLRHFSTTLELNFCLERRMYLPSIFTLMFVRTPGGATSRTACTPERQRKRKKNNCKHEPPACCVVVVEVVVISPYSSFRIGSRLVSLLVS